MAVFPKIPAQRSRFLRARFGDVNSLHRLRPVRAHSQLFGELSYFRLAAVAEGFRRNVIHSRRSLIRLDP